MKLTATDIRLLTTIYMGPQSTTVDPRDAKRAAKLSTAGYLKSKTYDGDDEPRYSITDDGCKALTPSVRATRERYHWCGHDSTRVRLWKRGMPGDVFDVIDIREFEIRAKDIEANGGVVFAGMPDDDE